MHKDFGRIVSGCQRCKLFSPALWFSRSRPSQNLQPRIAGRGIVEVCITGTSDPDNTPFEIIVPVGIHYFLPVDVAHEKTVSQNFAPAQE